MPNPIPGLVAALAFTLAPGSLPRGPVERLVPNDTIARGAHGCVVAAEPRAAR
ncbi:MAG: hypothetical protein RL562_1477, partial [Planctomycetota bacterium]